MISDIGILYFLGLTLLLFFDLLGLTLFRFRNINIFISVLLGYLSIIASYAIIKGSFNSIGVLVVIWLLGYVFLIKNHKESAFIKKQIYLQRLLIIGVLWSVIFALKVSYFWNIEYNCPNLLFTDYEFYMKVAEGYNLSGNENVFGLKNVLFPFLDFAQPYRSNDFWLVSLGLDITKIDTIYIWELFYSTILIFICSLSLFVLLKRKFNLIWSLVLSILILFAFSGHWYREIINLFYAPNPGSYDPIGIAAYTKLAIIFSIIFHFFYKIESGKNIEAIYFLILIPLLVQSSIAVFLLIFLIIMLRIFLDKGTVRSRIINYLPLFGIFAFVSIGFLFFYLINQEKEQFYIGYSNLIIANNKGNVIVDFIIQFFKKAVLMFISYYWLSFLLATLLLFITKSLSKILRIELFIILSLCYISCILVYAKFYNIGDSYQFLTNTFGPFVLALIIYLLIQTPISLPLGKIKLTLLVLVSIVGMKETIGGSNVFHSTSRIYYYDKEFIAEIKNVLPQLNYPLGVTYYGEELQNHPKEAFPQFDTTFLKLFGRYYDVFNIEADSLKMQSNQKINLSIKNNALNIWLLNSNRQLKTNKKLTREDFYAAYPFSFCISKISKDSLPDYIKKDIVSVIKDKKSEIYFYKLARENINFSNMNLLKK